MAQLAALRLSTKQIPPPSFIGDLQVGIISPVYVNDLLHRPLEAVGAFQAVDVRPDLGIALFSKVQPAPDRRAQWEHQQDIGPSQAGSANEFSVLRRRRQLVLQEVELPFQVWRGVVRFDCRCDRANDGPDEERTLFLDPL